MVVQLDKIYFKINSTKVFPFKAVKDKKNLREARVSELERLLKNGTQEEIAPNSPEFKLIMEWLGYQEERDALP